MIESTQRAPDRADLTRLFASALLQLAVASLGLLSPLQTTAKSVPVEHKAAGEDVRTLHFPSEKSIGVLLLIPQMHSDPNQMQSYTAGTQVAGAMGTVKVKVPPKNYLLFEANRRVFENPLVLQQVSPYGIDALKLSFISLADNEDELCDRALGYANGLKGLKAIIVDRSEATDAGLSKLKDLPNLRCVSCFLSGINGACLKNLAALPELSEVALTWCDIKPQNLAYLSGMPKLRILNLEKVHLDEAGAKYLEPCVSLVDLTVRGNAQFDDNCMKHLMPLKKLQYLDLGGTAVTFKSVSALRGLKLKKLMVPASMQMNLQDLHVMFADASIGIEKKNTLSKDEHMIYAPLR